MNIVLGDIVIVIVPVQIQIVAVAHVLTVIVQTAVTALITGITIVQGLTVPILPLAVVLA